MYECTPNGLGFISHESFGGGRTGKKRERKIKIKFWGCAGT